jgi:serine/threonine protein kinase
MWCERYKNKKLFKRGEKELARILMQYTRYGYGCAPSTFFLSNKMTDAVFLTQNNIMREAQTMILIDHPNVVKALCSFANNQTLWVVMPYMAGGSCLHIMKSVQPNGFEEAVIATVLREVLKGLEYLHHHGHIHRDVKVIKCTF